VIALIAVGLVALVVAAAVAVAGAAAEAGVTVVDVFVVAGGVVVGSLVLIGNLLWIGKRTLIVDAAVKQWRRVALQEANRNGRDTPQGKWKSAAFQG